MSATIPPRVVPAHRHSDECSKPEDHGDELNGRDGELVRELGEARRDKDKICDSKQGPDGAEQHEVNTRWRPAIRIEWATVGVDDCGMLDDGVRLSCIWCRITYGRR